MRPRLPIALSLRKIRKPAYGTHGPVARMERSVIRDCREASTPPRISLRSIRATIDYERLALCSARTRSTPRRMSLAIVSPGSEMSRAAICRVFKTWPIPDFANTQSELRLLSPGQPPPVNPHALLVNAKNFLRDTMALAALDDSGGRGGLRLGHHAACFGLASRALCRHAHQAERDDALRFPTQPRSLQR